MTTTDPRPRGEPPTPRVRGQRTRDALVAGARVVFERDGFVDARITDITAEAGVATGSFYTHFDSKEQVFTAVMADLQEEMLHPNMGDHTKVSDPVDAIRVAHLAYLKAYRQNARLMGLMEQVAVLNPELGAMRLARGDAFADRNAALIRRLQDEGVADRDLDPVSTAYALNAMASRMANLVYVHDYPMTTKALVESLTHLWANALGLSRPALLAAPRPRRRPGAGGRTAPTDG